MKYYYFVFAFLISGCTAATKIQKNMNADSYSLSYLQDSRISPVKTNTGIAIDTVLVNAALNDSTNVVRLKGWAVPLLFINVWNSVNQCVQGKSMFREDIAGFLKASLASEINRSGRFRCDTLDNPDYCLELSVDTLATEGPYVSRGYFYFAIYAYGYSYADYAGPAVSKLSVSCKLKKDGQEVLTKSYSVERITEQINRHYANNSELQRDYAISMVEAASFNFKQIIEQIVEDINMYLEPALPDAPVFLTEPGIQL